MNRNLSIIVALFLIASIYLSCQDHRKTNQINIKDKVAYSDTSASLYTDELLSDSILINARFSECGEWGGHEEKIIVSMNRGTGELSAEYNIYPFNCDSIPYYEVSQHLKPIISKRIELDNSKKKSITDYILRLLQSKITESFPGHAGNIFSVIKSDSTLVVSVYDNKEFNINSYKQLIAELF
jgi:hypothetical protein